VPNPPASKINSKLKPLPPITAKSAGFAIAVGALSAVLLAIPLSISHPLLAALLEKTAFSQYFQDHGMGGPRLMVWSWQHNDDLSYLDISKAGIAYLVGQYTITGDDVVFERNLSRIKTPEDIYRVAAVRLEVKQLDKSKIEALADNLSGKIVASALDNPKKISALQIDFDARESDRKFYSILLRRVRAKLPSSVKLSITALASWCLGDNWLTGSHLPVDEVVPMLFSLGLGHRQVTQCLTRNTTLSPKLFAGRLAPGLSINEPNFFALLSDRIPQYKRLYVFSSHGWSRPTLQKAQLLLGQDLTIDKTISANTHNQSVEVIK